MILEHELNFIKTELGDISSKRLSETINKIKNGMLVDIGVYEGASSRLMISTAIENNNKVFGIDPVPGFNSDNPNYKWIKDDSVKIGEEWDKGQVDLVFFDSVHAKEQVLCELYYWWDLIKEGGYGIFHDTSWKGYIHKPGHPCAGKLTGNTALGFDSYGGINWETPDIAIEEFFKIQLNTPTRNIEDNRIISLYEDDYIKVETNYALLGMTFITKKSNFNYKDNINNWEDIFNKRKILLSFFK
jgi:hypothetical protein